MNRSPSLRADQSDDRAQRRHFAGRSSSSAAAEPRACASIAEPGRRLLVSEEPVLSANSRRGARSRRSASRSSDPGNYFAFPLVALDAVLETRKVPYRANYAALRGLRARAPGLLHARRSAQKSPSAQLSPARVGARGGVSRVVRSPTRCPRGALRAEPCAADRARRGVRDDRGVFRGLRGLRHCPRLVLFDQLLPSPHASQEGGR